MHLYSISGTPEHPPPFNIFALITSCVKVVFVLSSKKVFVFCLQSGHSPDLSLSNLEFLLLLNFHLTTEYQGGQDYQGLRSFLTYY